MRLARHIYGRDRADLSLMMDRAVPGRCADCGSDAYIQLAGQVTMLCAHCYQDRHGVAKAVARKGGERASPKATSVLPRPS